MCLNPWKLIRGLLAMSLWILIPLGIAGVYAFFFVQTLLEHMGIL